MRSLISRAPAQDPLLAKGAALEKTTEFDDLILSRLGAQFDKMPMFKNMAKIGHQKIKDGLLWGLRHGDLFSADVIFAAELIAAGSAEQKISDPTKIDYKAISPVAIHKAVGYMDEAINASRNSRRGMFLAHPSALLSLLTIFAGHRISVATTTALRVRNVVDLAGTGKWSEPMLHDSAKYIGATVLQSAMFTTVKFLLMSTVVRGMYEMLTPDEDDERYHLYGEAEKEQIRNMRKSMDESMERGYGPGTLPISILRDMFGNIVMVGAFGGLDNAIFTEVFDPISKQSFDAGRDEAIDQMRKQIINQREFMTDAQVKDLQNQIKVMQSTQFAPMGFKDFSSDDLGGGFGAALQPYKEFGKALVDIPLETRKFSWEEAVLFLRTLGIGQPEITRALKFRAKAKDSLEKIESELPEVDL